LASSWRRRASAESPSSLHEYHWMRVTDFTGQTNPLTDRYEYLILIINTHTYIYIYIYVYIFSVRKDSKVFPAKVTRQ